MTFKNEPGYLTAFTRDQVEGALPNSTRIKKVKTDPGGDIHPIGAKGTVLGSLKAPGRSEIMYFVEWDASPGIASACIDWKIEPVIKQ